MRAARDARTSIRSAAVRSGRCTNICDARWDHTVYDSSRACGCAPRDFLHSWSRSSAPPTSIHGRSRLKVLKAWRA